MRGMNNAHAHNAIAQRLAGEGDREPGRHAQIALEALEAAGYHLLTAPKVQYDPPEGSPEYDAILEVSRNYAQHGRSIKRTVSCELDDEVLTAAVIVSPHEAEHYRSATGLKEHVERKQGIDFMHELWKRLAPETAVEP